MGFERDIDKLSGSVEFIRTFISSMDRQTTAWWGFEGRKSGPMWQK